MDGAIALYAREQAAGFQPFRNIPENEHSEFISYIFIHFTGERWEAELLIDPMYLGAVDGAWPALVAELNAYVLPYFTMHDAVGGYYPICTSSEAHFESPLPCLRLIKSAVSKGQDVLVPDVSKNLDTLCLDRIRNMTEIQQVLTYLGLPNDISAALQASDAFSMFAYLSQLAILKVLPLDSDQGIAPHVLDADGKLTFCQGTHLTSSTAFAAFMNQFFFAQLYEGYQYLAGEYPITETDVAEIRTRTQEGVEAATIEDIFTTSAQFCFSDFVPKDATTEEKKHYIETWCGAVTKRAYLIALLKAIAYKIAVSGTM